MKIIITLFFTISYSICISQTIFVVKNGDKQLEYQNLEEAIYASSSGDTLHFPTGVLSTTDIYVNKKLHWIGKSHKNKSLDPISIINSKIYFSGNCDGSSFSNIYFRDNLQFGDIDNEVTDVTISNCRIDGDISLRAISLGSPILNFQLRNSICKGEIDGKNAEYCHISNSILWWVSVIKNFNDSQFSFNIFSSYDYNNEIIVNNKNCLFQNNIFVADYGIDKYSEKCTFNNNIFSGRLPYVEKESKHTGKNNFTEIRPTTIFKDVSGDIRQFLPTHDYRLQKNCCGIKSATNGSDIGIYGNTESYCAK